MAPRVLDAKNRVSSGTASSDFAGRVGASLPILSGAEREACAGLGKAVYNFITSEEEPAPAKSKTLSTEMHRFVKQTPHFLMILCPPRGLSLDKLLIITDPYEKQAHGTVPALVRSVKESYFLQYLDVSVNRKIIIAA